MKKLIGKLLLLVILMAVLDYSLDRLLRLGLDRYLGLERAADVLCVGNSLVMLGFDMAKLETLSGFRTAGYAMHGVMIADRDAMIRHYLAIHHGKVRLVVYAVDDRMFAPGDISVNSYRLFYPYLNDPVMGEYVARHAGGWDELLARRLTRLPRYNSTTFSLALRGLAGRRENLHSEHLTIDALRKIIADGKFPPPVIDSVSVQQFQKTVRFVRSHGIPVVLLAIPTVHLIHQLNPHRFDQAMTIIRNEAARDPGVIFVDLNPAYQDRLELFCDPIHLNRDGQKLITEDVAKRLNTILVDHEQ
jgi:lysophospholipase L1-like esterase